MKCVTRFDQTEFRKSDKLERPIRQKLTWQNLANMLPEKLLGLQLICSPGRGERRVAQPRCRGGVATRGARHLRSDHRSLEESPF